MSMYGALDLWQSEAEMGIQTRTGDRSVQGPTALLVSHPTTEWTPRYKDPRYLYHPRSHQK